MDDIKPGDLVRVIPQYESWNDKRNVRYKLYNTPVLVVAVWDRNPKAPKAGSGELLIVMDTDGAVRDPWKERPGVSVWFDNQTYEVELKWATKISENNNER